MVTSNIYVNEQHRVYMPDENRTLSEAVLEMISEYENIDLMETDFLLYDMV